MIAQYTYDNNGNPIGVFLPIEDWNILKLKLKDCNTIDEIPQWQKEILDARHNQINDKSQQISLQTLLNDLDVMVNETA